MEKKIAKQIGQRLALKAAIIGLIIAYGIFEWLLFSWGDPFLKSLFWIADVEFSLHLFIGALGLLTMAYIFGQLAGIDILIKNKNDIFTGIKYGFISLVTGTLIGCTVGFTQEGIDNIGSFSNPFYDYYFKPLYWVSIFGIIPVIIVGFWFGRQIKKQGLKLKDKGNVNFDNVSK